MKNLYLIPTENSSRLSIKDGILQLHRQRWCIGTQHVYITNDEDIKDGDWCLLNNRLVVRYFKSPVESKSFKKIILTTDQYLIRDGVQAIDDEFLEWFVKNPSCEKVEVKHKEIIQYGNMSMYDHNGDGSHYFCKNCEVETSRSKEELLKFGVEYYKIIIPKEKPKQETLEEAMHRYPLINQRIGFKKGAKWQQERMYSEEDMRKSYIAGLSNFKKRLSYNLLESELSFEEWFEQFKKK